MSDSSESTSSKNTKKFGGVRFTKGNKGKPKGATNKVNREIKKVIQFMVDHIGEPVRLRAMLTSLQTDRPEVLINFLGKVAPKNLELSNPDGSLRPISIVVAPKESE